MTDHDNVSGQAMTIGALAKRTAVNIETIRYYERAGVLPLPPLQATADRCLGDDAPECPIIEALSGQ